MTFDTAGRGPASRGSRGRRGSRHPAEAAARSERKAAARQEELERDPEGVARELCLRLLTLQPRTRAQLREALRKRELPDDVAERVLDRLTDVRLVDDEAFADAWVQSRHAGRGLARRALSQELRQRGVAPETVSAAVEGLDAETEYETALALARRRARSSIGQPREVRLRRLAGLLARKGYPAGVATSVVRQVLGEEAAEMLDAAEADAGGPDSEFEADAPAGG
jgi:regulatory protein